MTWLCWLQSWHSVLLVLAAQPRQPSRATDWWQGNGGGKRWEMRSDGQGSHSGDHSSARAGQTRDRILRSWQADVLGGDAPVSKCRSRSLSVVTVRAEWGVSTAGDSRQGGGWGSEAGGELASDRDEEILRGWDPRRDWGLRPGRCGDSEREAALVILPLARPGVLTNQRPGMGTLWPIRGRQRAAAASSDPLYDEESRVPRETLRRPRPHWVISSMSAVTMCLRE